MAKPCHRGDWSVVHEFAPLVPGENRCACGDKTLFRRGDSASEDFETVWLDTGGEA